MDIPTYVRKIEEESSYNKRRGMWARNKSFTVEICYFFFSAILQTLLGTLHFISAL